jgi:hypothetical protein
MSNRIGAVIDEVNAIFRVRELTCNWRSTDEPRLRFAYRAYLAYLAYAINRIA